MKNRIKKYMLSAVNNAYPSGGGISDNQLPLSYKEGSGMCGRYQFSEDNEVISEIIRNTGSAERIKTGEIFPTDRVPVFVGSGQAPRPVAGVWGFPKYRGKGVIINARAETVLEKPMFRNVFLRSRCVIPSTGFYEWDKSKNKFLFNRKSTDILYMAGFTDIVNGEIRFVILTTGAAGVIAEIHERMPVVLDGEALRDWLYDSSAAVSMLDKKAPELVYKLC